MVSRQHRAKQLARARLQRQAVRRVAEQRRRRRRAVVIGLVVMVLLLAAGGVLWANRSGDPSSGAAVSWPAGSADPPARGLPTRAEQTTWETP